MKRMSAGLGSARTRECEEQMRAVRTVPNNVGALGERTESRCKGPTPRVNPVNLEFMERSGGSVFLDPAARHADLHCSRVLPLSTHTSRAHRTERDAAAHRLTHLNRFSGREGSRHPSDGCYDLEAGVLHAMADRQDVLRVQTADPLEQEREEERRVTRVNGVELHCGAKNARITNVEQLGNLLLPHSWTVSA
jgi:hypothetical protein